jgi:hypothetical protein
MLALPLNPAQVTRVRRRSDPPPARSGRQTHRAGTEDFGIIDAPARGKVVGARVLPMDRIDSLAFEHAHAPPVAVRSRCRGLAPALLAEPPYGSGPYAEPEPSRSRRDGALSSLWKFQRPAAPATQPHTSKKTTQAPAKK